MYTRFLRWGANQQNKSDTMQKIIRAKTNYINMKNNLKRAWG